MSTTPFFTNPLAPTVYVFDSHRGGTLEHTQGAFAMQFYGATAGTGEGPAGQAYGIPVRDASGKMLSLSDIKWHVEAFLGYARQHKETFFQVTRIGCGNGAYKDEHIAPLFFRAPANVWLPGKWRLLLGFLDRARLVVYGPSDIEDLTEIAKTLQQKTENWGGKFELVTNHMSPVGQAAEQWMRDQNLPTTPFVPDFTRFGERAHEVVCQQMAWYGTHLIAFSDGKHEDTLHMINIAKENGLRVGLVKSVTKAATLEMLT